MSLGDYSYGRLAACSICHCDVEYFLTLELDRLYIRYTTYKSLGTGEDPQHPEWLSLVTGQRGTSRSPSRDPYKYQFELFDNIWSVSKQLGRNGSSPLTYIPTSVPAPTRTAAAAATARVLTEAAKAAVVTRAARHKAARAAVAGVTAARAAVARGLLAVASAVDATAAARVVDASVAAKAVDEKAAGAAGRRI